MEDGDEPDDESRAEAQAQKHDPAFFVDLALRGAEAFRVWKVEHNEVPVTFEWIDFSQPERDTIDFSKFKFLDDANFSGCKWRGVRIIDREENPSPFQRGRAYFFVTHFGKRVNFKYANFGDGANFEYGSFGSDASRAIQLKHGV
jgi:uncharacterized protein YjbI with pentapeptide repeats